MSEINKSAILQARHTWALTIAFTVILGVFFLKDYLALIALAALFAYLFHPMNQKFIKLFRGRVGAAISLTTVVSILLIGVPLIIIMVSAVNQGLNLLDQVGVGQLELGDGSLDSTIVSITHTVNDIGVQITGIENIAPEESVLNFVHDTIPVILKALVGIVVGIVSGIPGFTVASIIYLFVFTSFLFNYKKIIETLYGLSPFEEDINKLYFKRMGLMAKGMVKGQLIIAALQGLASALSFVFIGLGNYFLFLWVIFTVMSIIPLGAGIVTIPFGLLLLVTGQIWPGLIILGTHFIIVTNIDNFRPKLVPKEAHLPAALTILAAFAGVSYFGFLGVIYGPIIMIIITTTIEMYIKQKKKFEEQAVA